MAVIQRLLVFAGLVAATTALTCSAPFILIGEKCVYVEFSGQQGGMSWSSARDYCRYLGGTNNADLASFPTCDQHTQFARYLALNAPTDTTLWLGAHTLFTPNTWEWVTLEALQTGVPFWYYQEDFVGGFDCAAADGAHYYRLVSRDCAEEMGYACAYTPEPTIKSEKRAKKICPDHSVLIGDFCYMFDGHEEDFTRAEERCRDEHEVEGGELYYPSDCDEFANIAHHLEATEDIRQYWVGAIDISGMEEWTWVNGGFVPGGPPYWASGAPTHAPEAAPRKYCASISSEFRFYLTDNLCTEKKHYICKLTHF